MPPGVFPSEEAVIDAFCPLPKFALWLGVVHAHAEINIGRPSERFPLA